MAAGRIDKTGKIEINRFMEVLKFLKSNMTFGEIIAIGDILCCFDENDNKLIYYYDFLSPIKILLVPPEQNESKELSLEPSLEPEAFDKKAEEALLSSPEENKEVRTSEIINNVEAEEKKETSPEDEKEILRFEENKAGEAPGETEIPLPELNENWCEGEFSIVINRCHNCNLHREYTRHYEDVIKF